MPDSPNSSLNRPRWLPDLLATRVGRLTAFFFLYVSEGIPLGFTATAVATQMRRQDLTPGQNRGRSFRESRAVLMSAAKPHSSSSQMILTPMESHETGIRR